MRPGGLCRRWTAGHLMRPHRANPIGSLAGFNLLIVLEGKEMRVVAGVAAMVVAVGLVVGGCSSRAEGPETAERESAVVARAAVESVDQETRQVLLRTEDGRLLSFVAGPEVRNLGQVESGDVVRVEYYQAVAVEMAQPGDSEVPMTVEAAGRAAEGEKPGAFAATATDFVVEVVSYDPDTALALVLMPDGEERVLKVAPEMRDFAAAREPGDRVRVTVTQAVAIGIEELGG